MLYVSSASLLIFRIPFRTSLKWRWSRSNVHWFGNASLGLKRRRTVSCSAGGIKVENPGLQKGCYTVHRDTSLSPPGLQLAYAEPLHWAVAEALRNPNRAQYPCHAARPHGCDAHTNLLWLQHPTLDCPVMRPLSLWNLLGSFKFLIPETSSLFLFVSNRIGCKCSMWSIERKQGSEVGRGEKARRKEGNF